MASYDGPFSKAVPVAVRPMARRFWSQLDHAKPKTHLTVSEHAGYQKPWVSMLKCSNDLDDFRTPIREILNHKFVDLATRLAIALMESAPVWSRRW